MVVFVGVFFPLLTNVVFGVRKINPNWIDAAKTLGANQFQIFYKVIIPGTVPYLMNGVKIGLGIGWMCIISAEMYSSTIGGIGQFILNQIAYYNWPGLMAGIVVVSILGILTVGIAGGLHKLLSKRMGADADD
jgi:NitT/TauT family transport system permease protein